MSLTTRYLDLETLHHYFGYASDEVMHNVLDNVEQHRNVSAIVVFLERYTNAVFLRILFTPVSL